MTEGITRKIRPLLLCKNFGGIARCCWICRARTIAPCTLDVCPIDWLPMLVVYSKTRVVERFWLDGDTTLVISLVEGKKKTEQIYIYGSVAHIYGAHLPVRVGASREWHTYVANICSHRKQPYCPRYWYRLWKKKHFLVLTKCSFSGNFEWLTKRNFWAMLLNFAWYRFPNRQQN